MASCLLYTSDAADEGLGVDLGGRRIIKNSEDMKALKRHLYRLNRLEERYYDILIHKLKVKGVSRGVRPTANPQH